MKKIVFSLAFVCSAFFSQAQTLQDAVTKTMNERYEAAEADFNSLLKSQSADAQVHFFAGDNYLYWGELDQAEKAFNAGVTAVPGNPLNHAGLGRIAWMKGNAAASATHFAKAEELMNVKGSTVDKTTKELTYLKMAECFLQSEKKDHQKALNYLNLAVDLSKNKRGEINITNPELHIQLGDAYSERDGVNLTNALSEYSKALEINPLYTRAMLRQGQLYVKVRNWEVALEFFDKAIETDPTFAPAYREKAELLYKAGRYQPAIDNYKKYLELNNSCRVQQRYASFIFLTKDYNNAIKEVENALPCNPNNMIMYRVLGYGYYETGNYQKGIENIDQFFKLAEAKDKTIITGTDLGYKGKLLAKTGQDSLGIELIKQAIAADTSYIDGYSDIASIYIKSKRYTDAAYWYQQKIDHSKEPSALDYYYLGQAYYYSKEYSKSDAAFANATERYPDAWFWRGKCNNKLDNPDQMAGLGKPFFETAIAKVGADPKNIEANKKNLIEAYSYLGIFYGQSDNYECSRSAWNKVLELDATNKVANDVMTDPKMQAAAGNCELIPAQ